MDPEKLTQRLMVTFLAELQEHVRVLNRDLLALEAETVPGARAELITVLFRTAHSLKGAARSVNVAVVETACHELESLLAAARDGVEPIGPGLFPILFAAADALDDAGRRLSSSEALEGGPLARLIPRLRASAHPPARTAARSPGPAPDAVRAPRGEGLEPRATLVPTAPDEDRTVRIAAGKLDELLSRSGELLVARRRAEAIHDDLATLQELVRGWSAEWESALARLREAPRTEEASALLEAGRQNLRRLSRELAQLDGRLTTERHALEQTAAPLDAAVRSLRMLPFARACEGLERTVRDLAAAGKKDAGLVLEGIDVELDHAILEGLASPLLHLVRNAVAHGLETPTARRAAGKPERGRITVSAALRGGGVEVAVEDDGRGVDLDAIREQARRRKLTVPDDPHELAKLIFTPGFTTAGMVTSVSGRGVGLDVVRARAEALHGSVAFSSEPGRGCRFVLTLPLTLTTLRVLFVAAGGQVYGLPAASVARLVRVSPEEIGAVGANEVLKLGGSPIPVASLAGLLGGRPSPPRPSGWKTPVVVLSSGLQTTAVAVDELLFEREVVIMSLGPRLSGARSAAGGTILPTGRVALVLNVGNLVEAARTRVSGSAGLRPALPASTTPEPRKRLLIAEDSVTTRTLVKSILESSGFEVLEAADGLDGWHLLQDHDVDLVVSDVDMPRMDGFSLTTAIRDSKRFRDLPIVLVTALHTETDRERGLAAGADAYLVKSAFDQGILLDTIRQLL